MSDEDMVAHLARCMLDPAMPRASIETLLHAFVPAPHVHHTHPDGINVLAGTADGERLVHECFGDSAAWVPYIRPGFTLSKQVGEAARANPDLKLVVLAKHGLVVWGDTAEEAYRRTIEVINQAVDFANERAAGSTASAARTRRRAGRRRRARRAAARAAARRARRGLERDGQAPHGRHLAADAGVRLLGRGRAARDGRGAVPGPPRPHQARPPVDPVRPGDRRRRGAARAHRRARRRVPRRLPRLRRRLRRRDDGARRPRPADRARPAPRPRLHRPDDQDVEDLARPLPPRDRGDGGRRGARGVRLPRPPRRASPSSTGRSSSTSSPRRRRPASCRARWRS